MLSGVGGVKTFVQIKTKKTLKHKKWKTFKDVLKCLRKRCIESRLIFSVNGVNSLLVIAMFCVVCIL